MIIHFKFADSLASIVTNAGVTPRNIIHKTLGCAALQHAVLGLATVLSCRGAGKLCDNRHHIK